jgi:hypothetical protein
MRKTVPFVTLLFLVGIAAANGCSPVATPPPTATPVPTPDIAAAVETAVAATLASQPPPPVPTPCIRITGPSQVFDRFADVEGECYGIPTDGHVSIELFLQDPADRAKYWCVQRPVDEGGTFTDKHWKVQGQFGATVTYRVFAVAVEREKVPSLPGCKEDPGQNYVRMDSEENLRKLLENHVYHNDRCFISEGFQVERVQ